MQMYNCALVGDEGVGKSTYLQKLITGECSPSSPKSRGIEVKALNLNSKTGQTQFNIWNISNEAGQKWLKGSGDKKLDFGLICFSLNDRNSSLSLSKWAEMLKPHVRQMICLGFKSDLDTKIDSTYIEDFSNRWQAPYFKISSYESSNVNAPWVFLSSNIKS